MRSARATVALMLRLLRLEGASGPAAMPPTRPLCSLRDFAPRIEGPATQTGSSLQSLIGQNERPGAARRRSAAFACDWRRGLLPGLTDVARKHKERRLMGYSQQQMFDVVSAVEHYKDFVPWCVASRVIKKTPTYLEAELEVGFQLFVERYLSKVTLKPPHSVRTITEESTLFHHLESTWEIKPGPNASTCWLAFEVDFAFKSQLYRQVATVFFEEVVQHMMAAFEGRCNTLYGPSSFQRNGSKNGSLQRAVA